MSIKKDFETIFDLVMETERQELKKKYEEAAKARYPGWEEDYEEKGLMSAFQEGAEHASKEGEAFIQTLKKMIEEKDEQMALQHEIHKNSEKEAHNEAIDKALKIVNTTYTSEGDPLPYIQHELEKLKL